ncbi:MAG TPA: ABC transporter ATP-binding protein [Clostridiales bacterium]|jgi:putative ABC transport system ATP-binding protein|nr:ABC transporter ATP-binding protein [Clostridiales bacterium]
MKALKTEGLTKIYRQGDETIYAVRDADFELADGEMAAIKGASGSGKSTLLHLLAGLDRPSHGKIFLRDKDIASLDSKALAEIRRREIGFVYQQFNLVDIFTARENIVLPSLLDDKKPDEKWFDELTEMLGIRDRLEHLPSELSGGQLQRVAIARALINRPAVLLADEPTGSLDRETAQEIISLFLRLHLIGTTIAIVTHDEKIAGAADTVWVMDGGEIKRERL